MMTDEIDLSMRQRDSDDVSEKSSYISLGAPSVHEGDIERREVRFPARSPTVISRDVVDIR
jgi:hypothetical protein